MMTSESSLLAGSASLYLVVPASLRLACLCTSRGMCVECSEGDRSLNSGRRASQGGPERRGDWLHSTLTCSLIAS